MPTYDARPANPQPGDRVKRQGRCHRCDLPLADEEYQPDPVWLGRYRWHATPIHKKSCAGEAWCINYRVDWRTRALEAEGRAEKAEARVAALEAAYSVEQELHEVLNDLLALFYREAKGLSVERRAYAALAHSCDRDPKRPITVAFIDQVRALLAGAKEPGDGR